MQGQKKSLNSKKSFESSWSTSDLEDELETTKTSQASFEDNEEDDNDNGDNASVKNNDGSSNDNKKGSNNGGNDASGGSNNNNSKQQEQPGLPKKIVVPKRNNFRTMELSDSDDEGETSGYRSPAPSRLSFAAYPDYEYENDEYEDYDDDEEGEEGEELMEIQIETLTGTTFRVRVSSRETVMGLKSLLYRTEGLPASQQHLLLGQTELVDGLSLRQQGVKARSLLRLVISLKGGPLNARRVVPPEDVLWREVSDIVEERRDEIWDSSGGRAVTLLVLRDGDSVNLYRVLEHEDGSFSPLNQSWGSQTGPQERSLSSRAEEDARTQTTMQQLKQRMEDMRLKGKKQKPRSGGKKRAPTAKQTVKTPAPVPSAKPPPSRAVLKPRTISQIPPDLVSDVTNKHKTVKTDSKRPKSGGGFKRSSLLPQGRSSRPSTQERSIELRKTSTSRASMMLDEFPHSLPPRSIYFSGKRPLDDIKPKKERARLGRVDEHITAKNTQHTLSPGPNGNNKPSYASYRQSLVKHGKKETDAANKDISREKSSKGTLPRRDIPPVPFYISTPQARPRRDVDPLYSSQNNFDRLALSREFENRPKTSPEILERRPGTAPGTSNERIILRNPDNRLMDLMSILNVSRGRSQTSPTQTLANSFDSNRYNSTVYRNIHTSTGVTNISQRNVKPSFSSSFSSNKLRESAALSKPSSPAGSSFGSVNLRTGNDEQTGRFREIINSQMGSTIPSSRKSTPEKAKKPRRPVSGRGHVPASPARLPPVTPKRKKIVEGHRPRCAQCKRRIQISTTHNCRCGRSFCAQHRYAETHACTFDYKAEGRKLLQLSNPLVEPQKLPKI